MTPLDVADRVAWTFVGTPYLWGGDDPLAGFDCSGLVIEILKSCGVLPRTGDWTAQGLYERYADKSVTLPTGGCLAFWRRSGRMTHVEYCIDWAHTIGASGGGSNTNTMNVAVARNAYVKVRPIRDGAIFVDPFSGDVTP